MPVTIKSGNIQYKSTSSGEYVGINSVSERTTAEQVADLTEAGSQQRQSIDHLGQEVLDSIPSDYTNLSNDVDSLKSAITEKTRNLWEFDSTAELNYYKIFGTQGVTAFPAGTYTLSFVYTGTQAVELIIYCSGGSLPQQTFASIADTRQSYTFTASSAVERFFFSVRSSGTGAISDIQIETGSTATNYILPITAVDKIARDKVNENTSEIETIGDETETLIAEIGYDEETVNARTADLSGLIWDGTKFVNANSTYNSFIIKVQDGRTVDRIVNAGSVQRTDVYDVEPALNVVASPVATPTFPYTATFDAWIVITFYLPSEQNPSVDFILSATGIYNRICDLEDIVEKPFAGKKILCFGDSITEFKDVTTNKSYPDYLKEMCGGDVINVGIGGTRLSSRGIPTANPTDAMEAYAALDMVNLVHAWIEDSWTVVDSCVTWIKNNASDDNTEIINRLKANSLGDTDIIIIMIGGNDITGGAAIGSIDSSDTSDYSGAFNTVMSEILTKKKNVKIYVFTNIVKFVTDTFDSAHFSDTWETSRGVTFPLLNEQIVKLAKKWHYPCGDMYYSLGWNMQSFQYYLAPNHTDGSHPNRHEGFKIIAEHINSFMRNT